MSSETSALSSWSPAQIAQGREMVRAWAEASAATEELRRRELQELDVYRAIELLCGPADYFSEPRAPKPESGLIEQQRWFKIANATRKDDT